MAYFWSGDGLKDFLFKGFNIDAKDGLATLCVGIVGSAILYEGLRTLRDYLLNTFIDRRKQWRILENRCSRIHRSGNSPIEEIGSGEGPSGNRGRISTSHYAGGSGDSADASASLMTSPVEEEVEEEEDYEVNSTKHNVPKTSRRTMVGDTAGKFSTLYTEKCHSFSLLAISTLIHMIYITLGYMFMLAVMTFNVWILVAVAIGVGIGQFLFGVFRRTDNCINEPSLLTGNTSSDICNPSPSSNPSGSNSQNRQHSTKLVHEEDQEEGAVPSINGDKNVKNERPLRTGDVNVQSDYYSNSSSSRSSGSENQRSEQLTTTEISVHNVSTPDSYPKNAI